MEAFIFFHLPVSEQTVAKLEARAIDLVNRGMDKLTIVINSGGGNTFAGLGAFHLLRSLPLEIHTHAHSVCGSIAASIFLAGSRRTVSSATAIILHATTYSEGPFAGQPSHFNEVISKQFREVAGWGDDLINRFLVPGENYLMPPEAIELNFAHEVIDLHIPKSAEIHHIS
ncbi:ATP-dependent Clp protease proteolytic subunit [Pseudomonas syringae]|uniref:ATP-dependent Clp protease proteolytic subunit n=1 Tax=Pseudomonas syringae TaxID=317 RepID=UPI000E314C56|nr:ATP-dependent Clp protease proteolytic subunit [Pseudomonas syringae]